LKVVYTPQAIEDLTTYVQYVAVRNPGAASRFAPRVFTVIGHIANGDFESPAQRLRSGTRLHTWPVYPLRIYYQRTSEVLSVVRIYHQARRSIVK
jgi:plasmid stabilization system protein ParE